MSKRGSSVPLRTVAAIEAAKGIVALLLSFGLLDLLHRDLDDFAERLIEFLHINPAGKVSNVFFTTAGRVTNRKLWYLAAGATAYAALRLAEAFGLWRNREWAQWFALLSGGAYLPLEVYALFRHPRPIRAIVFAANAIIVGYMLTLRIRGGEERRTVTNAPNNTGD